MGINPLAVIERCYSDLNTTDRQLADYVLANAMDVSRLPIDFLSEELGVSKSTIVRFAQKLGFSGFASLKQELARQLLSHQDSPDELPERCVERITETYAAYITDMADELDPASINTLANRLCGADRIVIAGTDRALHAAAQLRARLANVGVRAQATDDVTMLGATYNLYGADDVLVVFTVADTLRTNAGLIKTFADAGVPVVCVTCTPALPFKGLCSNYVVLPRISRDPNVVFLDDEALFFVFIEILIDAVAKCMEQERAC